MGKSSRTKVLGALEEGFAQLPGDQKKYAIGAFDYLFRNNVPVWFLERFNVDESLKLKELFDRHRSAGNFALERLFNQDVGAFLSNYKKSSEIFDDIIVLRDRHIAKNLDCAERDIRVRYPEIKADPLNFFVQTGASHNPELYAHESVKVVDLVSQSSEGPEDLFIEGRKQGKSYDELHREMLLVGIKTLLPQRYGPLPEGFISMSYQELVNWVKR